MYKPSNNPRVAEITAECRDRSCHLDRLQPVFINEVKHCAWCAEVEIRKGNQKYCSIQCNDSAMAHFYPQKENALLFLLIRQDFKCSACKYDYRPALQGISDHRKLTGSLEDLPWWAAKRLKNQVPPDKKPEVDHVIAITNGGTSLGLGNHQAICFSCHKLKTSKDLSGPRKKRFK